jgi:hypothetical protein
MTEEIPQQPRSTDSTETDTPTLTGTRPDAGSVPSRLDAVAKQLSIIYDRTDGDRQDAIARANAAIHEAMGIDVPEREVAGDE